MAKTKEKDELDRILDEMLVGKNPEDILGEQGLLKDMVKRIVERTMDGEMTHHLGYEKNSPEGKNTGNSRNGRGRKKIKSDLGEIEVAVPRDRNGNFEPRLIRKNQTRFPGFDDKIISMYARGMSTREIAGHLRDMYNVDVSPEFISQVTNAVVQEVIEWQNRSLDSVYPIVYLDALFVKIRDDGHIRNKAVYLALGVNLEGHKEVLGLWVQQTEGAKFWLAVLTELKNRGVEDILIACVDGLSGFPEAIESVFAKTQVQLCIVHMVRNSLKYVSWKDRRVLARDLKSIYRAPTEQQALANLDIFAQKWDEKYSMISKSWRQHWEQIIPFFGYPADIRKAIYTTNAIESLNSSLRKVIKNRGSFPSDEACLKLIYLALRNASRKWSMPIRDWGRALNQFSILFDGRIPID